MRLKFIPALRIALYFIFFGGLNLTASAQFSSMAIKAPALQLFFAKMSPNTPEFSAVGQMDVCDSSGTVQLEMPMNLSATTNVFRWEADISQAWPIPPQVKAMAKQMRTDKMVFLVRKNQQIVYMIYPDLKAYVEFPIPGSAIAASDLASDSVQLRKTPMGRESINGHPCIKNKVMDIEPNSRPMNAGVVWNATDLQGFPIKMELPSNEGLMRFNFQEVITQVPGAWLFQIPSNYTLFKSSAELMEYAKNQATRNGE